MSSSPVPPPPRRTAQGPKSAPPHSPSQGSFWDKLKPVAVSGWDKLYAVSDKVGYWSNKQTAKIGTEAFYPTNLETECGKAARILRTFTMDAVDLSDQLPTDLKKTQKVIKKIPPQALAEAQGLAIFTVMRTGFIISGAGGSGIVLARLPDGTWSAPSGILLHTLGVGLLVGADIYDVVLILRTHKAVQTFAHPRVTVGGELSVAAGPYGNGFMLESGVEASPVWSYVKSKGLYGGVQIDGNILIERNDENERSYGRQIKASEILEGKVDKPYWSTYKQLEQTILAGEGKDFESDQIPTGFAPSESLSRSQNEALAARRLPPQELDDEDLAARKEMDEAMRSFGIADPEAEAHRLAREADPHLQRQDSTGTSQAGSDTPPLDPTAVSSPESSLRPLSLAASINSSPPMLPPRPSLELETDGRPLPPPRCDSESNQSPLLVEVGEGEAPPMFEAARRSLEMARKSSEETRSEAAVASGKPPVPPRRSPRVGGQAVGATTPIVVDSPVMAQEDRFEVVEAAAEEKVDEPVAEVAEKVEAEADEGAVAVKEHEAEAAEAVAAAEPATAASPVAESPVTEDDTELESDATSFVDAESTTGTVTEEGAEKSEDDEVAAAVAKIDG